VSATAGNVHATVVVMGDRGIVIVGRSGSGKSALAQALLDAGRACGRFASLVADDQVFLETSNNRIVARAPEAIAGLIEVRGLGPAPIAHETSTIVDLVVSLVAETDAPRIANEQTYEHGGVSVPLLTLPKGNTQGALRPIAAWLRLPPFC